MTDTILLSYPTKISPCDELYLMIIGNGSILVKLSMRITLLSKQISKGGIILLQHCQLHLAIQIICRHKKCGEDLFLSGIYYTTAFR